MNLFSCSLAVVIVQAHPYFAGLDWDAVLSKAIKPAYIPRIAGGEDISNFDKVFTRVCTRLCLPSFL